jgi:Protein of unknown function (DUF4058)
MPIHDWSKAEAGIFHDFHHGWIEEIKRTLNDGLLPADYYALAEQRASGIEADVLALQLSPRGGPASAQTGDNGSSGLHLAPPKLRPTAETDVDFYRRKQSCVAVRHVSGDELVAVVEIVSVGNKSSRRAITDFVQKTSALLAQRIHLLIVDVHKPGARDPNGIHGLIWEDFTGQQYAAPADKPLTAVAYEAEPSIRAYVMPLNVGDNLPDMPLFLQPNRCVELPLEATYLAAWKAVPRRWRDVIDPPSGAGSVRQ